jgi:hypothetical protein
MAKLFYCGSPSSANKDQVSGLETRQNDNSTGASFQRLSSVFLGQCAELAGEILVAEDARALPTMNWYEAGAKLPVGSARSTRAVRLVLALPKRKALF